MATFYDYKAAETETLDLYLRNSNEVRGEFIQERINRETIPEGKVAYEIMSTDDGADPAILRRGIVRVNFYGTFITSQATGLEDGEEIDVEDWDFNPEED